MNKKRTEYMSIVIFIFILVFFDQFSKYLIIKYVELNSVYMSFFYDFFRIIHVRNTGILFSIGSDFSSSIRNWLFILMPICILILILIYSFKEKNKMAKFALLLIFSGGIGNIIDRIFRPLGVIDFLDLEFFGIMGLDRWPAFNFADIYVVIGMTLYVIFDFILKKRK